MTNVRASGIEPGQRRLNGPQTTGRHYRNLSQPTHSITRDNDVPAPMRDGINLLADVHRPAEPGRYPVLIAASPYPRQIQDLGAPAGFIEAGSSDFFVPRGYVHVIANNRGTSGSGGTFGFFDGQERRDMYDLVEWAAAQPWSDGSVGMIGISYFAGTQMEAAVERPPHLKAIMPIAGTYDLYESATHHGLMSSSFLTPFLAMIGMTSGHTNKLWRSKLLDAVRHVLLTPTIHKKFETANGEAAIAGLKVLLKLHHAPHPWDDLWRAIAAEHPTHDEWCGGDTPSLAHDLDIVGPIELQLDAISTAPDTAFIAILQDVDEAGEAVDVTAGYLRAGLRKLDEATSKPGAPVVPCQTFEAVPIGQEVRYRIPVVPNARHFKAGHKIRLYLTTDDQAEEKPALLFFRHASIGTNSLNTILPSSRLLLPVLPQSLAAS